MPLVAAIHPIYANIDSPAKTMLAPIVAIPDALEAVKINIKPDIIPPNEHATKDANTAQKDIITAHNDA